MIRKHVVVDGSNIATEARSSPSLRQLDEAVRAFLTEHPTEHVTVVVDATFGHRIDESERVDFDAAVSAGEIITAPAGAIGRGDAFVLQVADKGDATILSNDSFQEFHGQYTWLFDEGRLIGGKPVPPVGWVFLLRSPVRGAISRRAVKDAKDGKGDKKRGKKSERSEKSDRSDKGSSKGAKTSGRGSRTKAPASERKVRDDTVRDPASGDSRRSEPPLNEALPFIEFVGAHPVGSRLEAEVEKFSSHGAYVLASGARCYVPLRLMGDPTPRSPRDALRIGDTYDFAVHSFDVPRRGIDLALTSANPKNINEIRADEPALATVTPARRRSRSGESVARQRSATKPATSSSADELDRAMSSAEEESTKTNTKVPGLATTTHADQLTEEAPVTPAKKASAKKAAKKTTAKRGAKKATAKRSTKKKATAKKRSTAKRATKKSTAKKSPAKRSAKKAAKKRPTKKKAAAKKRTTKKAAKKSPAKRKAAAKKRPTKKKAAAKKRPTKKKAAAKKRTTRRR
jgi:hypothetical protein